MTAHGTDKQAHVAWFGQESGAFCGHMRPGDIMSRAAHGEAAMRLHVTRRVSRDGRDKPPQGDGRHVECRVTAFDGQTATRSGQPCTTRDKSRTSDQDSHAQHDYT